MHEGLYQTSSRERKEAPKNGRESQPIVANPSKISDLQTTPERSPREDMYPLFKGKGKLSMESLIHLTQTMQVAA